MLPVVPSGDHRHHGDGLEPLGAFLGPEDLDTRHEPTFQRDQDLKLAIFVFFHFGLPPVVCIIALPGAGVLSKRVVSRASWVSLKGDCCGRGVTRL